MRALLGNIRALPFSRCSQILLYSSPADSRGTRGGVGALPSEEAGVRRCGMPSGTGTLLSGEAGPRTVGCVAMSEPSLARRRGLEPRDTCDA
jgi:hypothetical protein